MAKVIKNNKSYDSADVDVTALGNIISEVEELTYNTEQEHQVNHGLKRDAQSWSQGKKRHNATITLPMHEAVAIESAADGDVTNIKPFDINVTFTNEYNVIVNDTLVVKFATTGREITGDMNLKKQYTLFTLDIDYNNI